MHAEAPGAGLGLNKVTAVTEAWGRMLAIVKETEKFWACFEDGTKIISNGLRMGCWRKKKMADGSWLWKDGIAINRPEQVQY